jgi:S1-C subfamily serine protease
VSPTKHRVDTTLVLVLGGLLLTGCALLPLERPVPTPLPTPQPTQTPWVIVVTPTPLPPGIVRTADVEEQLVVDVYSRVSPAVVYITSRIIVRDFFWGAYPQEGTGSGFVIDKAGHIVTNNHVVENADTVIVTLSDETSVEAEIIGTDPGNDVAVLRIDVPPDRLQPVELGTSGDLRVGQRAIAIGNPFGLDRTLTTGVISSLGRPLEVEESRTIYDVIQTDAAINPGNSGGPLLDSAGKVIGMNTAIYSPTGSSVGLGFAVPVDTLRRVVDSIIAKGYYPHPSLGIRGYDVTPELAEILELPVKRGIMIFEVVRGGAAARAGIRGGDRRVRVGRYTLLIGGDIVIAIDGNSVQEMGDLTKYLETRTQVGQLVDVTVVRDGSEQTIQVQVGQESQG